MVTLLAYDSVTNEIPSTNAIGVVEINSATTNTLTAVPWKRLASAPDQTDNLTVSNLVAFANLSDGDAVYMWDSANRAYKMWTKSNGAWGAATTVNGSGASVSLVEAEDPDVAQIPRGSAVWVSRQNPVNANGSTNSFFLVGQYDESAISVMVPGATSSGQGVAVLANPFSINVTLNAINWSNAGAGDMIRIPRNGLNIELSYNSTEKKWGYYTPTVTDGMITGVTFTPYNDSIPAGTGFLYYRKGDGFTLEWK